MAESQSNAKSNENAPRVGELVEWQPGDYWQQGQPVPRNAILVHDRESGHSTLQEKGPATFDKQIRETVLRQLDLAWERSFANPSEELPEGKRPWVLWVNEEFDELFPNLDQWGQLEPRCPVRMARSEKVFDKPGTIEVQHGSTETGKPVTIKARFDTDPQQTRRR